MWLPAFGEDEKNWPNGLRIVLYVLGLFYCFLGVAVASRLMIFEIRFAHASWPTILFTTHDSEAMRKHLCKTNQPKPNLIAPGHIRKESHPTKNKAAVPT